VDEEIDCCYSVHKNRGRVRGDDQVSTAEQEESDRK
jgi:hypothetical protein